MLISRPLLLSLLIAVANAAVAEPGAAITVHPVSIDAKQAFVGKRQFRIVNEGKDAGMITVHTVFDESGRYLIHDHSSSDVLGVQEELFAVLDGTSFAPLRTQVHARMGSTYLDANWEWDGLTANGKIDTFNFDTGAHGFYERSPTMPEGALTRAAALYLLNAMDLAPERVIELNWFDSSSGRIAPIRFSVQGSAEISVPAGTFDTFVVLQQGGEPENTIYITKEIPRRIVRFDVSGVDMQLELMSLE